ncbi:MEI2-like protein 5 isoform X1 [Carex rostrata]
MDKSPDYPILPEGLGIPFVKTTPTPMAVSNAWKIPFTSRFESTDASFFSSSLPVLPHDRLIDSGHGTPSIDDGTPDMQHLRDDMELKEPIEDFALPDEEDLLAGILGDFDMPESAEELEEYDVFGSGGMEMDSDPTDSITMGFARTTLSDGLKLNGAVGQLGGVSGAVAGEHPYGEHPSRTLFVRNINSNVEDSELRAMFEIYGDIRSLYTATKHRGFVMISYYDIRDARQAMRGLQNKPLRRRKLDIHFSIPKDNPSEKDLNQGTLVIFNLEPSVSNEELRQIFGAYGEVKEIRETPHKRHHKFIEFYDVRAADAALRGLNKSEIAGKRIKLEPSRPGGARRNLMQQLGHDFEDESRLYRQHVGSPLGNSPPGTWTFSPTDNSLIQGMSKSPSGGRVISPIGSNGFSGLSSLPATTFMPSNSVKIAPIGKDPNRTSISSDHPFSHSFPDNSTSDAMNSPGTLTGPQFLWGSPKPYSEHSQSSSWQSPPPSRPSYLPINTSHHVQGGQGILYGAQHNHHHVGSAPPGMPFETHIGFLPESPDTSYLPPKFGSIGPGRNNGMMMNLGSPYDGSSPKFRIVPPQHRLGPTLFGSSPFGAPMMPVGLEALIDRAARMRRIESPSQVESRKQYQLDLEKIISGDDPRTTLMIKNIPNKYTSKMLLAAIDEKHKGTYDFFYLPIDFKNKCNVGYAFINMSSPTHIASFYESFNGKKWEKFNSEKVASLAYARIQGRVALISHFQNSSLMNEDKRCRPILFHCEGPAAGIQEPFPLDGIIRRGSPQDDFGALEDWAESSTKGSPTDGAGEMF